MVGGGKSGRAARTLERFRKRPGIAYPLQIRQIDKHVLLLPIRNLGLHTHQLFPQPTTTATHKHLHILCLWPPRPRVIIHLHAIQPILQFLIFGLGILLCLRIIVRGQVSPMFSSGGLDVVLQEFLDFRQFGFVVDL